MDGNNKKYLLCLDLSLSNTGYAIFDFKDESLITKGVIETNKIKTRQKEVHSEKLLFIFNALNKLEKEYNFEKVVMERAFVKFNNTTKVLNKVVGVIELLFNKKEIILISPQSVKSLVCGNGRASKEEMISAINFQCDIAVNNDNEADAIGIGLHFFANR